MKSLRLDVASDQAVSNDHRRTHSCQVEQRLALFYLDIRWFETFTSVIEQHVRYLLL